MTKHSAKKTESQKVPEEKASARGIVGTVVSCKMNKTIVVQVMRLVKHKLYGKIMRRYSKMYVHDAENQCHDGDIVKIQETRPMSKSKRWKLLEIVKRSELVQEEPSEQVAGGDVTA